MYVSLSFDRYPSGGVTNFALVDEESNLLSLYCHFVSSKFFLGKNTKNDKLMINSLRCLAHEKGKSSHLLGCL